GRRPDCLARWPKIRLATFARPAVHFICAGSADALIAEAGTPSPKNRSQVRQRAASDPLPHEAPAQPCPSARSRLIQLRGCPQVSASSIGFLAAEPYLAGHFWSAETRALASRLCFSKRLQASPCRGEKCSMSRAKRALPRRRYEPGDSGWRPLGSWCLPR